MANVMNQGAGDTTLHPLVQGAGSHPPLLTIGIPGLPLIITVLIHLLLNRTEYYQLQIVNKKLTKMHTHLCQGCQRFETSVFFSEKINISTTGGSRVGFFQPDTNHP